MDISAMKKDLKRCLDSLPPGMIDTQGVVRWVLKNKPNLEVLIPQIIEILKPHFMAGAMESAMGVLPTSEVEEACIEVLMSYGINVDGSRA